MNPEKSVNVRANKDRIYGAAAPRGGKFLSWPILAKKQFQMGRKGVLGLIEARGLANL